MLNLITICCQSNYGTCDQHPIPVEFCHLLDEVVLLQQDRAIGIHGGERERITGDRDAGIICCLFAIFSFLQY